MATVGTFHEKIPLRSKTYVQHVLRISQRFRRNIIFSFKYKTSHLMAKNTILWTPIQSLCLISIYIPLRRPNFTVAKTWLFSLWKDVTGIKYNTKINLFMVVYPVWSKPDNWALKQCHNLLWWPIAGLKASQSGVCRVTIWLCTQ